MVVMVLAPAVPAVAAVVVMVVMVMIITTAFGTADVSIPIPGLRPGWLREAMCQW